MTQEAPVDQQADEVPASVPSDQTRPPRLDTLIERLFNPVDAASLVFFRIFFGIVAFWHVWGQVPGVGREYIAPDFHFTFYGLSFVKALPGEGMNAVFLIMAASTIFIALGLFYRWAAAIFFLAHTYAFFIDQAGYWNHYYLTTLLGFLLIFLPLNRAFSLDVARGAIKHSDFAPAWSLWTLRGMMGITYFYAGLAKLNGDWLRGTPMNQYLANDTDFPLIGPLFGNESIRLLASHIGLGFDLLIVPLLLWPRTRYLAIAAMLGFHLFNSLTFDIEAFPWFAIAATLLFLPPDWPRFGGQWRRLSDDEPAAAAPPIRTWASVPTLQKALGAVLAVFFIGQLLLPLRVHLYPGNALWTGQGYFFSWRMLIANKDGRIQFHVTDKATGAVCRVNPSDFIAGYQISKVSERPDMMIQFAHLLRDRFRADRGQDIEVRAWSEQRLNDRPWLQFIDPRVDLTQEKRSLGHHSFIIPLEEARPLITVPEASRCPPPAAIAPPPR